jgi:hypothetical protein
MDLQDGHNGGVKDSSAGVIVSPRNGLIDKCLIFYRAKFHFVTIVLGIIFSIIHLKFAIEYLGQCPIQPMINIYMIVNASVTLCIVLLTLIGVMDVRYIDSHDKEDNNTIIARRLILIIISLVPILLLFNLGWLVAGSVWIFGAKSNGVQGSDPTATTTYCQSDLYRAAFVLIIVTYVSHALIIVMVIKRRLGRKKGNTMPPVGTATIRF